MPLSEHEQRLLDEMERSLYHNEADDVTTVGGGRARPNYTAIALGIIAGVIGIALLLTGVISRLAVIGLIGFACLRAALVAEIRPRQDQVGERGTLVLQRAGSAVRGLAARGTIVSRSGA